MFKKIIALIAAAACVFTVSQTAFAWDRSKIVVDTSGAVQIYEVNEPTEYDNWFLTYYTDKNGNKFDGKYLYANFADEKDIVPYLRLAYFEDVGIAFADGFSKNSKGKRYYESGERVYGWKKIDGYWYHFDTYSGYMDTGKTKICGAVYTFDKNGRWTKRVSKSGLAPEDFSVNYSSGWGFGFDTAKKEVFYGPPLSAKVKIPAADRQVLWCMYLESGFETGSAEKIDFEYMENFIEEFGYGQSIDVKHSIYGRKIVDKITVTAANSTAEITFDCDVKQISLLDEKAYRAWLLDKQYSDYRYELENN